jgi:hypothetical protein
MSILRSFVVAVVALQAVACTTMVRPTRPSSPLVRDGEALTGLRFDGEEVQIREPGMPVSPSRAWQREVANYTASALNESLGTDDMAPAARTIVTFDLASPSALQLGPWKEITIGLTSTLPDGTVVRSAPVTGNIDDGLEHALVTGMGIGGTVLDVTAGISSIFFIFSPSFVTGAVFIGALVGGLALNIGQSTAQYFVALSEEGRWSDLYATALRAHVVDVRAQIGRGPPPLKTPPPPLTTPTTPTTPTAPSDPSDAASPPPLLDPAEPGG